MTAPAIATSGMNAGRSATCLAHHGPKDIDINTIVNSNNNNNSNNYDNNNSPIETGTETESSFYSYYDNLCNDLAQEITTIFDLWILEQSSSFLNPDSISRNVTDDFSQWMDTSPQTLRKEYSNKPSSLSTSASCDDNNGYDNNDDNNQENCQSMKGEQIIPLRINSDGTLDVKVISTGNIRTLIADYLW